MGDEKRSKTRGLPVLNVTGESFAGAWENSVLELWNKGIRYPRGDSEDNGIQAEATMTITTNNPRSNIMIHKYSGGTVGGDSLMDYALEVLGARDSWRNTRENDYTYHGRFNQYPGAIIIDSERRIIDKIKIDQIAYVAKNLTVKPWSRRSNMITWVPQTDPHSEHTPCLQRAWFEITPGNNQDEEIFNVNYHFRSRNVMNAALSNMLGLSVLWDKIRTEVEKQRGKKILLGRVVDITDSYHVSTRDYPNFESVVKNIKKNRKKGKEKAPLEQRTFSKDFMLPWLEENRAFVVKKISEEIERYCSPESKDAHVHYTPEQIQAAKDKLEQDSHFVIESFKKCH